MLYIESKRLGRGTAVGLLSIAFVFLVQGLFGAWKMKQLSNELSETLVRVSHSQVEILTLKSMLINLRKLEKDILLHNQSTVDFARVKNRWKNALQETNQQFLTIDLEIQQSQHDEKLLLKKLENSFHAYSDGVTNVIAQMVEHHGMQQSQALKAMARYKKHIYDMEFQIDEIVHAAETYEHETISRLEKSKTTLFITLGLLGLSSVAISIILSMWIMRKNIHISQTLEHQALHDTLTGRLNRRGLSIAMADNSKVGVIAYIDLDRFKLINDICGHTAGDKLLVKLTKRMDTLCQKYDCKLARVGGDEFVFWLVGENVMGKAYKVSQKLVGLVESFPFYWMEQKMDLGVSVGLAQAKANYDFIELVSRADAACQLAKIPGNKKVIEFEESDPDLIKQRNEEKWAVRIPQMLTEGRFCLYGQHIKSIQGAKQGGHIEVLIRGVAKDGGIIPPGVFLPAAERFGLMPKIDRWVVETLLSLTLDSELSFSVNLSAHTLADQSYLPKLIKLIEESGKADQLVFEITETAAMTSIDTAREYIRKLKALGCKFSLDDFGSGFSSFAYLRDLNVDYLKIDGSLIKVLERSESDTVLVQAIIKMADALGLQTIAEYVETTELAEKLTQMNVDYGQGYGLHKPELLMKLL